MKLDAIQAFKILNTLECSSDYVESSYGNTVKKVVTFSKQRIASKIHIKYWHQHRLKKGTLFTMVQDRLASKKLYRRST